MFDFLYSVTAFIVAIGVLVTIHEFGHYWVARKMGVKVLRFSVGFGKPLLSRTSAETGIEYTLGSIPLGGYVKMLDEREGDVDQAELDQSFNRKSVWKRFAIVAAGPAFNFLFAIVAYTAMFLVGIAGSKPILGEIEPGSIADLAGAKYRDVVTSINGIETPSWEKTRFIMLEESVGQETLNMTVRGEDASERLLELDISSLRLLQEEQSDLVRDLGIGVWRPDIPPVIDQVIANEAAEAAGIKEGDLILSLNDMPINNLRDWVGTVRDNPGKPLSLEVQRNAEIVAMTLIPGTRTEGDATYGFVGVMNRIDIPPELRDEIQVVEKYGLFPAISESVDKTWRMSWLTLKVLGKLVIGEASIKNLSGPITIARYAGMSAQIGFERFIGFLAIISISLGVLNLLPVPVLDGGHLFYYLIEMVKGSPVSETVEVIGQKIGLVLLFGLMSLAIYNDLLRLVN